MLRHELHKISLMILILSNLTNLINFLLKFLLGRFLSVEDYGILNAVSGLGLLLVSLANIIPLVVTKYVVQFSQNPTFLPQILRKLTKTVVVGSGILCVLFLLITPLLSKYLQLNSAVPIIISIFGNFFTFLLALLTGILNGKGQYLFVNGLLFLSAILSFLFSLTAVVVFDLSYNAVFLSGMSSVAIICVISMLKVKPLFDLTTQANLGNQMTGIVRFSFFVGMTHLIIGFFTNIDIIMVKHFCSEAESGIFAAASLLAKIVIFLPAMLNQVLFPEVLRNQQLNKSSLHAVAITLLYTLIVAVGYFLFISIFGQFFINFIFGDKYLAAANYLPWITLAMVFLSLTIVTYNMFLAQSEYRFLPLSVVVLIAVIGIMYGYLNHSPKEISVAILLGSVLLFVVNAMLIFYLHVAKHSRRDQFKSTN